jgi:hypothetical protein
VAGDGARRVSAGNPALGATTLCAGAIGAVLGLASAEHQVAVETAQVLAGLVAYPPDNPFGVYHLKLWNLASQLSALALRLGAPERAISLVLSGLLGATTFTALGLAARAAGAGHWLAVIAPAWIFAFGAADLGVSYEIVLLGSRHTYGILGLGFALLALASLGAGRTRSGLLLLGLAPAVHPSVGAWAAGVGVLSLALGGRATLQRVWPHAGWLALGALASAASLAVQLSVASAVDLRESPARELAVRAFVRNWDWHRRTVPLDDPALIANVAFLALAATWLLVPRLRDRLPPQAPFLLRAIALSATLGLALCALTQWQDQLPLALVVTMPGRMLNLSSLALAALLLGLLGTRGAAPRTAFALVATATLFAVAFALLPASPRPARIVLALEACVAALTLWLAFGRPDATPPARAQTAGRAAYALAVALLAATTWTRLAPDPRIALALVAFCVAATLALAPPARLASMLRSRARARALGALGAALAAAVAADRATTLRGAPLDWLRDHANDPFFAEVARGEGLLLTAADLSLVQLRSRRPVVIDGSGLDGLPYAPESAPQLIRILREIYGEDLYAPSREIREKRPGALLPSSGAGLWHERDAADWARVGAAFGFRDILTRGDWALALPRAAERPGLVLYRVPESPSAQGRLP